MALSVNAGTTYPFRPLTIPVLKSFEKTDHGEIRPVGSTDRDGSGCYYPDCPERWFLFRYVDEETLLPTSIPQDAEGEGDLSRLIEGLFG